MSDELAQRLQVTATAPAKAILIGEHAVNRGQAALAVSVGLYATCTVTQTTEDGRRREEFGAGEYRFESDGRVQTTTRDAILNLGRTIDAWREAADYAAIQRVAANDFFAPAKYVLASVGNALPPALQIRFSSDIPQSAGLGSGGASFVTLAAALAHMLEPEKEQHLGSDANSAVCRPKLVASWAQGGDIVAHGGIASGLDTQTSLYGGAIRYTAAAQSEPIGYADGLTLVIGNSGVFAATSEVNGRVRRWLADRPLRMHYFDEIGLLSRLAEVALRQGDWPELGRLLNLNQLILERIGVSCPELEALNEAALGAGALGAKLSGSGGGGIMIALVQPERAEQVAQAITVAGGTAILAPIGVPGVRVRGA